MADVVITREPSGGGGGASVVQDGPSPPMKILEAVFKEFELEPGG